MKVNNTSWLIKTGQTWKILIFIGISAIDLLLLILMIWSFNNPKSELFVKTGINDLQILTAFLVSALAGLMFLFISVQCPKCKKRPIYRIIKKSNLAEWFNTLIAFDKCPYCGYKGKEKSEHQ